LSREASERTALLGVSGVFFFEEREGDGEGGFLGSGDGVLLLALFGSDLCVGVLGTEIRSG